MSNSPRQPSLPFPAPASAPSAAAAPCLPFDDWTPLVFPAEPPDPDAEINRWFDDERRLWNTGGWA